MHGKIGAKGGSCGARIYRNLPGIGCVLLEIVGRSLGNLLLMRAPARCKSDIKLLGVEKLRDKREDQNQTYNV